MLAGIETLAAGVRVPSVADVGSGAVSAMAGAVAVCCCVCTAVDAGVVDAVVVVKGASGVYDGGMAGVFTCTADDAGRV